MCGILGLIGARNGGDVAAFERALQTLAHRGPDAQDVWIDSIAALGHRRLAIIDLSNLGDQPMLDPDSGMVIVFNGEIYNYKELRSELQQKGHNFRTRTDTEVLLKGYVEWGPEVLGRCNGMWAFAIWDPVRRSLFMARDRFGVKPFYYSHTGGRMIFASEPKALHALSVGTTEIDTSAIVDLVVDSRLHAGARTFYRRIEALPPAHYMTFDPASGATRLVRYWDYPTDFDDRRAKASPDQFYSQFDELFRDSVRLRLRSDVPVGITLSGGLDSTAVLAAMNNATPQPPRCFTSTYTATDLGELEWAKLAAQQANLTPEPVTMPLETWWSTLPKIVSHMDSPGYSPAVLPYWAIAKRARHDSVPVLLEGQGADELLAGYPQYSAIAAIDYLRSAQLGEAFALLKTMNRTFSSKVSAGWLGRMAYPRLADRFTKSHRISLFHPEIIDNWSRRGDDRTLSTAGTHYSNFARSLWRDHAVDVLPALLQYGDAVSMAHGIESRLPFMDYRLVEWVFRNQRQIEPTNETKTLIRQFLRRTGFSKTADRQGKEGYPTPLLQWYKSHGRHLFEEQLNDPGGPLRDLINPTSMRALSQEACNGSYRAIFHLYKFITTDLWLREIRTRSTRQAQRSAH